MKLIQIAADGSFNSHGLTLCSEVEEVSKANREFYSRIGYHFPWIGYFAVIDDQVVGTCGFKGKAENGKIELAYYTFKQFEGNGYAKLMLNELIRIKKEADQTDQILLIAQTESRVNASNHILKQQHFVYSGDAFDEDAGIVWEWHYK
ncbi:MAG: GNAT family N-acetyltransferase [Calditrichaeota bacterium]|nr:GNAT family N-acetyltransferase [Calditrichota bacterium]